MTDERLITQGNTNDKVLALMPNVIDHFFKGYRSGTKPDYYLNLYQDYICANRPNRWTYLPDCILLDAAYIGTGVDKRDVEYELNKGTGRKVYFIKEGMIKAITESADFKSQAGSINLDYEALYSEGYSDQKAVAFVKFLCCMSTLKKTNYLWRAFSLAKFAVAALLGDMTDPSVIDIRAANHTVCEIIL